MGKKKDNLPYNVINKIYGRRGKDSHFARIERHQKCLYSPARALLGVTKLDEHEIKNYLAFKCMNIEQQIIALRNCTQLTHQDWEQRYKFTKLLLTCLFKHHSVVYEGILFGSTINGLGFRDSDVDLRLRPLTLIKYNEDQYPLYEPVVLDDGMVDRTLRDIAFQTTKCSPAAGEFVPSSRCPVAKLTFVTSSSETINYNTTSLERAKEGLKYDISLSANNFLGPFNSLLLRFFCHLEPKFHLLATVIRYWSSIHRLIVPGLLSSYALVNMLIFFCQTTKPPVLPTIDQMREIYLNEVKTPPSPSHGLTQLEWSCMVSLKEENYATSKNTEPLSVLLLKFFEMYLNFPYSTHIITTRPGRALEHEEYRIGPQFHPRFPINTYLNIQDPFDLRHNLTSGMQGEHFQLFMLTMRHSYERLFQELLNNFRKPYYKPNVIKDFTKGEPKKAGADNAQDPRDWGLNVLFVPLTEKERKEVSN